MKRNFAFMFFMVLTACSGGFSSLNPVSSKAVSVTEVVGTELITFEIDKDPVTAMSLEQQGFKPLSVSPGNCLIVPQEPCWTSMWRFPDKIGQNDPLFICEGRNPQQTPQSMFCRRQTAKVSCSQSDLC